jgi:hypothetical protein
MNNNIGYVNMQQPNFPPINEYGVNNNYYNSNYINPSQQYPFNYNNAYPSIYNQQPPPPPLSNQFYYPPYVQYPPNININKNPSNNSTESPISLENISHVQFYNELEGNNSD